MQEKAGGVMPAGLFSWAHAALPDGGRMAAHFSPPLRGRCDGSLIRGMHREELMSPKKLARGLCALAAIAVMSGSTATAQNLDQGKPAPKLFSESCVTCHRSPRGLAKGRFRLTLYLFLQKHYVSGSSSAWALASYLESVDGVKRNASRAGARPQAATTGTARTRLLPPAPVPAR